MKNDWPGACTLLGLFALLGFLAWLCFGCALTPYNRAAAGYGPTDYGLATPPTEVLADDAPSE